MTGEQARRVRRYYESNTRWMLRRGIGRTEGVLHRPVWVDGAEGRREALRTAERLIAASLELEPLSGPSAAGNPRRLLDLGCGAGASAVWLAERFAVSVTGITVSPLQARTAQEQARRRGLQERCRYLAGDFLEAPPLPSTDDAYAVESFSHAADPRRFLQAAAELLPPGGRLVICDDFLAEPPEGLRRGAARERCLRRLRRGWHLESLIGPEELLDHAAATGFALVSRRDLTPWLRLEPRGLVLFRLGLGLALQARPFGSSRLGGAALQQALRAGWVRYLLLVLRRR